MQEDGIAKNRQPKPHPYWSSDDREKPAGKPRTRTRASVQGTRADNPRKRPGKKNAP